MTRISVITAVYNRERTVAQALDSVFAQVGTHHESVIVDGASTDATLDVLERYRARAGAMVSERDGGIYDALNKGIRMASGDVIGFLHADDLFAHDHVLQRIADKFTTTGADAVYGDLVYVDEDNPDKVVRYWRAGEFDRQRMLRGWMPPHPTLYVRRSVYERLGAFDTRYRIAADYDSIVRFLFVAGIRAAYVPEVLVRMRVGGASNRSLGSIARKSMEDLSIMRTHRLGGIATLAHKNFGKLGQFFHREHS